MKLQLIKCLCGKPIFSKWTVSWDKKYYKLLNYFKHLILHKTI